MKNLERNTIYILSLLLDLLLDLLTLWPNVIDILPLGLLHDL